jgi:hypothetical protein
MCLMSAAVRAWTTQADQRGVRRRNKAELERYQITFASGSMYAT